MCLAIPAKVTARLEGDMARVDLDGVTKEVSLILTPEAAVGDYVILHVGYALSVIDPAEAERTLGLIAEMAAAATGAGAAP